MLQTNISIGFPSKTLGENIQIHLKKGEFAAIIGRNGSGKTTLLKTISGFIKPLDGTIKLNGNLIQNIHPQELAKRMSLVTTDRIEMRFFKVWDLLSLGRQPYTNFFGQLRKKDKQKINDVIQEMGIEPLVQKTLDQLSDGERQKVMIARAIVQNTPLILLDEPTAHLDIPNRFQIFSLLKKWSKQGKAILLATHEIELALQVVDKVILFDGLGNIHINTPKQLIELDIINKLFERQGIAFDKTLGRFVL